MNPTAIFRRKGDVIYRVIDDEAVVVRTGTSEVLGLNAVGARILDLVDGELTVGALIERLASEYEVDRAQLEADVELFLREMTDDGVLEPL